MTKQEQIDEIAKYICNVCDFKCDWFQSGMKEDSICTTAQETAKAIYNAGYRKTFTSDLASDTQKAFKEGYEKARKETAKEIFQKVVNICRKEEDFQDGTVNTQLEPLYFGIMNGCAFIRGEVKELAEQYGVEVEE